MKIIKEILQNLAAGYTSDLDLSVGDLVYHPYKLMYGDLKKIYRADSLNHALTKAQKKGLINKRIDNESVYLALTNLGREELTKLEKSRGLELESRNGDWDGRYRLVIFDIPEKSRVVRDALRYKLKEFGFIGWQKSVWVTKNNVTAALRKFVKENNLQDHILVIETDDVGNAKLESVVE